MLEEYIVALRVAYPRLRLVPKSESRLCALIDRALRVLTLGGQSAFMKRYVTTLDQTIYLPSDWEGRSEAARYEVMRHEAVHLRQFRRLGLPWMAFLYLLPFFPLGLAWGRARLEWEAYAESLRARAELAGIEAAADPEYRAYIVRQFSSSAYGWMWPFPSQVGRWIDRELATLRAQALDSASGPSPAPAGRSAPR
ncbi:MAG: hypothetical protein OEY14_05005 [Myxococcales bacterium]|nr:hypothetical protein [Myxococcales bacterium]